MSTLGSLWTPEVQLFDDTGAPLDGGLIYFYAAGTTTPQNTYPTSALTPGTENSNPVQLDSAGRAAVFLDALAYKVIAKTSAGVTLWTLDNVYPSNYVAASMFQPGVDGFVQGRLTLTSGTPVTVTDVTAATSIYFTPFKGTTIALYTGATWALTTFAETTLSLSGLAANTNYDIWGRLSSNVLALDTTAWTSDTARATALTTQNGVYVKSGDATRRYLGTFRTTATIGQTEDSGTKRYLWNYYNRVPRNLRAADGTNTWAYTTATWRQANGTAANQVDIVVGVAEVLLNLAVQGGASNTNAGVGFSVGIGEDVTNSPLGSVSTGGDVFSQVANVIIYGRCVVQKYPAIGRHYYAWLEISTATGTTTWIGDGNGFVAQNGLQGTIDG